MTTPVLRREPAREPKASCHQHWNSVAAHWKHWGPPLRPSPEDTAVMREAVLAWCHRSGRAAPRVLLLGVTPEIATMSWPTGTRLLAVDRSAEMIEIVWPGDVPGQREAMLGEWLAMPFANGQFDVVIGDGCFIHMAYPTGWRSLGKLLRRVLKDDGLLVLRFFVQGPVAESVEEVYADLRRGAIGSFHVFKWRLAVALQKSTDTGVCLHDIWENWEASRINPPELARQTGWIRESIETIRLYREKRVNHSFPTLDEAIATLQPSFRPDAIHRPGYELGIRCPIVVLRPS
jgi:SAM-dependent methyltransferase